ncbi:MAG: endonuclease III domain-containing protein [Desulfovermiculus sp.]|nr:endonuclease III domain-containing protein [Desulfovermiculus sp.]
MNRPQILMEYFQAMSQALGSSRWWPAESRFEVCIGAVLTQNTNWRNASRAIETLRERDLLIPQRLDALPADELAELIRPAGYFRVKANRLKALLAFLNREAGYDLARLSSQPLDELRPKLLAVKGVGQETADSILLYALRFPVFVVDAYTARIMYRHAFVPEEVDYAELQEMFTQDLPRDAELFNEYHALLVRVGKNWCKKASPKCTDCPLGPYLG